MEQAAPLRTDLVQDATVILEGCPSGDEFAQACLVEQQACKTECLSEGAEQSQDSEHEPKGGNEVKAMSRVRRVG